FDLGGDGEGEVALELQDIAEVAIEFSGPKVSLIAGLNELGGDANALAGGPYAAFEQVIHTKFTSDLGGSLFGVFVLHGRGAGNHPKVLRIECPELGNHLFSHAIGKEILVGICAQVHKRENDEHLFFRQTFWRLGQTRTKNESGGCENDENETNEDGPADLRHQNP